MFSLIEHYTGSPKIIVSGFPSSGKKSFLSALSSKHVGNVANDRVTEQGFQYVNYKGEHSFYIKIEPDFEVVKQIAENDRSNSRNTYFILFINAVSLTKDRQFSKSIRDWLQDILAQDEKFGRLNGSKSNSVFIALSHLDCPEAITIDEIEGELGVVDAFRKSFCNLGFPNYEKQVDILVEKYGTAIGAKSSSLKDALKGTERLRQALSSKAVSTTHWLAQQSTEIAENLHDRLYIDDSTLASICLISMDEQSGGEFFNEITGQDSGLKGNGVTIQTIRNFHGYSFKLCCIHANASESAQILNLIDTSNGIIFVFSPSIDTNEQNNYFTSCLKNITENIPVLYVGKPSDLSEGELDSAPNTYSCQKSNFANILPVYFGYIAEKQGIKTLESKLIASILPQLEEKFVETLGWTKQKQSELSGNLHDAFEIVSESMKDYKPIVQQQLGTVTTTLNSVTDVVGEKLETVEKSVSETVGYLGNNLSEGVKNVSNTVSSYWSSWWGNDQQ